MFCVRLCLKFIFTLNTIYLILYLSDLYQFTFIANVEELGTAKVGARREIGGGGGGGGGGGD